MKNILRRIISCKGADSTAEFARTVGIHPQTVDNYLTEKRKISLDFFIRVCQSCNVSADWLLGFTDSRTGTCAPSPDTASLAKIAELEAKLQEQIGIIKGLEMALKALGKGE